MLELKEGVVVRITKDEYPENIGKRAMLRHRVNTNFVAQKDLDKIRAWVAWPIDDIAVRGLTNPLKTVFKGLQKTYLFHLILEDGSVEALESDNVDPSSHTFIDHPLENLINTGMDGNVTD